MKQVLMSMVLVISLLVPIHTNAETKSSFLVSDSEHHIQQMMKEFPGYTKAFDILPMLELQLTNSERMKLELLFPKAAISEVKEYQTASIDTVPVQFPLIQAEPLKTSPYTGLGVKVAVIDTGIDTQHADLKVTAGICTLKIGCTSTPSYDDDFGHGTHVAGVIAAQKNNFGIIGLAPNVELYAVKAMNKKGSGNTTDIAAGLEWAIKQKVDIINMSLVVAGDDQALKLFIDKAYTEGILVVASVGNEGVSIQSDSVQYPAKYQNVIGVTAINQSKQKMLEASTGPAVEIAAPGYNIISTFPSDLDLVDGNKDGYTSMSGTSMAAPHVTGILALYKERFPSFSNKRLRELITMTAEDLGTLGRDAQFGFGMVRYKQGEITEIPYPIIEETLGKVQISLQNSMNVKEAKLMSGTTVIKSGIPNQWELYLLKGDYSFDVVYTDNKNIKQKDTVQISVEKPTFTDMLSPKWYSSHVAYLSHKKYIFGLLDGSFQPEKLITRAEAVALLGRVYGLNGEQKKTSFKDVEISSFASGYIQNALESGILSGFPDGTFRPNQSVTRAEMAILLNNAYSFTTDSSINTKFTDVSPSMASHDAIQALVQSGITKGFTETQFVPDQYMTRATYSVFIARAERGDLFD